MLVTNGSIPMIDIMFTSIIGSHYYRSKSRSKINVIISQIKQDVICFVSTITSALVLLRLL